MRQKAPHVVKPAASAFAYTVIFRQVNVAWFRFGMEISRFTTPVIRALVFAVAVVPTGSHA